MCHKCKRWIYDTPLRAWAKKAKDFRWFHVKCRPPRAKEAYGG